MQAKSLELFRNLIERFFAVVNQVHLIYRGNDVLNSEQRSDIDVLAALGQKTLGRIQQDDRCLGC